MHPRVAAVDVVPPFALRLRFSDGSVGMVDLAAWLAGRGGVFLPLQDPAFFAQVTLDREAGTVVWPNGVDLDADVLFETAVPID